MHIPPPWGGGNLSRAKIDGEGNQVKEGRKEGKREGKKKKGKKKKKKGKKGRKKRKNIAKYRYK